MDIGAEFQSWYGGSMDELAARYGELNAWDDEEELERLALQHKDALGLGLSGMSAQGISGTALQNAMMAQRQKQNLEHAALSTQLGRDIFNRRGQLFNARAGVAATVFPAAEYGLTFG